MLNGMGWKTALNTDLKTPASYAETGLVKYQQGDAVLKSCSVFLILAVHKIGILSRHSGMCLCWHKSTSKTNNSG